MMKNAAAASAECQRSVSAEILQHIEIFCNQNKTKEVVTASVEVQDGGYARGGTSGSGSPGGQRT